MSFNGGTTRNMAIICFIWKIVEFSSFSVLMGKIVATFHLHVISLMFEIFKRKMKIGLGF